MKGRRPTQIIKNTRPNLHRFTTMATPSHQLQRELVLAAIGEIIKQMAYNAPSISEERQIIKRQCLQTLQGLTQHLSEINSIQGQQQPIDKYIKAEAQPETIALDQAHRVVYSDPQQYLPPKPTKIKPKISLLKDKSKSCSNYLEHSIILQIIRQKRISKLCCNNSLVSLQLQQIPIQDHIQIGQIQEWARIKKQLKLETKHTQFRQVISTARSYISEQQTLQKLVPTQQSWKQMRVQTEINQRRKVNLKQKCQITCMPGQTVIHPAPLRKKAIMDMTICRKNRKRNILGDTCAFIERTQTNIALPQQNILSLQGQIRLEKGVKLAPLTSRPPSQQRLETIR